MTNIHHNICYCNYIYKCEIRLKFIYLQVEIEGLTGEIRFNDDGRRQNYTLHVVEMTVNSAMVKVSYTIMFYKKYMNNYSML